MANEQNTNVGVPGTAATIEHVGGIMTGATVGYVLGGGVAAVASAFFPPFAPIFLGLTPGLSGVVGGWIGHKATTPK